FDPGDNHFVSAQPPAKRGHASSDEPPRGPRKPAPQRPRFRVGWWLAWIAALLIVNYWIASRATQAPARVRVPYSPFFLQQVNAGHVAAITSKGTAVQGTFTSPE